MYATQGCAFTDDMTPEEKLAAIESFDEEKETNEKVKAEEKAALEEVNTMSLASIAAQLEFQNMMSLPDVEEE